MVLDFDGLGSQYCIAQTGILYMGPGVPIPIQQLGGSITTLLKKIKGTF